MHMFEISKLNKLLTDYCKKEKATDQEFLYSAINIVSKSRKYGKYLKDVEFSTKEDKNAVAEYRYFDKKMIVYPIENNKNKSITSNNIMNLRIVLHELEHVGQFKLCFEGREESIRKNLLRISFEKEFILNEIDNINKFKITKDQLKQLENKVKYVEWLIKMYPKMYQYLPCERMAEIDSFKTILKIIDKSSLPEVKKCSSEYERGLANRNLMGYDKRVGGMIVSPVSNMYRLLEHASNDKESLEKAKKSLESCSEYFDLENRLYLGLPISSLEYDNEFSKTKIK